MTWWQRFKDELRSVVLGPYATGDPALSRLFGGGPTSSGEPVTADRAIALTAVWACITLIAGSIASMPLVLYKRVGESRERYTDHPLYSVLHDKPNPAQNVMAFWEAIVTALLLRGNAYALLSRGEDNRIRALWYVHPDRVAPDVLKTGRLRYRVSTPNGTQQTIADTEMLHVVGPMSDDGYTGRSVISTFRETLGLGLALERYGAEFFSNAATPRGMLTAPGKLSDAARKHLTDLVVERHASPGRRHRTMILEEGLKFEPIALTHEDSQFVESRRFTTEEVARIFGVPGHMVGGDTKGSLTYSNAETEGLRLLKHTLGPWCARIVAAVNHACISPLERRQSYAEYLPDALLMTDTAGRYAAYKTGLEAGFLTLDEVRRKENLPTLPQPAPTIA